MKSYRPPIRLLVTCLLLPLLCAGCIGDDTSGCPSLVELKVVAQVSAGGSSLEEDAFNTTGVYVFDRAGLFAGYGCLHSEDAVRGQVVELSLDKGMYTLVTWCGINFDADYQVVNYLPGGGFTDAFVKGVTRLEDMRLRAKADKECNARTGNLFWNEIKEVTVAPGVNLIKLDARLMKNTNQVEIVLKGAAGQNARAADTKVTTRASDSYNVSLTTVAGIYKFDNSTDKSLSPVYTYLPYETVEQDGDLRLRLHTMRLFADTPVTLTVADAATGTILYTANLIELIMQNPAYRTQGDLDAEDTYEIALGGGIIVPGSPETGITIAVNGWKIIYLDPQTGANLN